MQRIGKNRKDTSKGKYLLDMNFEKLESLILLVGMKNGATAVESIMNVVLKKIKNLTSIKFTNPTSGYLSKRIETFIKKNLQNPQEILIYF